jgi:threonine dehydratase
MKILLIHPLAESNHHIMSGITSPATANAKYHRGVMLPRKVHSGLGVGGMLGGFAMAGTSLATLMSTLAAVPQRFAATKKKARSGVQAKAPEKLRSRTIARPLFQLTGEGAR